MHIRMKMSDGISGRAASVESGQEGIDGRTIRRERPFKRNLIDGRNRRRNLCSCCQGQQELTDAALLRVVTVRDRLAGRGRMVLDAPKVLPSKRVRAGVVTVPALASGGSFQLRALGQMRKPEHARCLKGEDAEQEPIHDSLHGDSTFVQSCIYLSRNACRQSTSLRTGSQHALTVRAGSQ